MVEAKGPESEFERGKEAGRVAQILTEHSEHLMKINGSVADTAKSLIKLTSELQALREEATLRQERVEGSLAKLAAEIEHHQDDENEPAEQQQNGHQWLTTTGALALAVALALVAVMFMALSLAD